jgi:hypothetical protein
MAISDNLLTHQRNVRCRPAERDRAELQKEPSQSGERPLSMEAFRGESRWSSGKSVFCCPAHWYGKHSLIGAERAGFLPGEATAFYSHTVYD